jgi:hypothetical protein
MIRDWFNPIYSVVPRDVRISGGVLGMSLYAAINPMSWIKSPYFGVFTFIVMWWWFWSNNTWNVVRYQNESWEHDKWWWILRTSLWATFTHWMLLFLIYLGVLGFIKLSSIKIGAAPGA